MGEPHAPRVADRFAKCLHSQNVRSRNVIVAATSRDQSEMPVHSGFAPRALELEIKAQRYRQLRVGFLKVPGLEGDPPEQVVGPGLSCFVSSNPRHSHGPLQVAPARRKVVLPKGQVASREEKGERRAT